LPRTHSADLDFEIIFTFPRVHLATHQTNLNPQTTMSEASKAVTVGEVDPTFESSLRSDADPSIGPSVDSRSIETNQDKGKGIPKVLPLRADSVDFVKRVHQAYLLRQQPEGDVVNSMFLMDFRECQRALAGKREEMIKLDSDEQAVLHLAYLCVDIDGASQWTVPKHREMRDLLKAQPTL
jgi:hypothetical protein